MVAYWSVRSENRDQREGKPRQSPKKILRAAVEDVSDETGAWQAAEEVDKEVAGLY